MSAVVTARAKRRQTIEAVITRADGRIEDLGLISYYHSNPLLRWPVNAWLKLKGMARLWGNKFKTTA